jgi:hypothetical protein
VRCADISSDDFACRLVENTNDNGFSSGRQGDVKTSAQKVQLNAPFVSVSLTKNTAYSSVLLVTSMIS